MSKESAYAEVERLVKKFKALSASARKAYNEDNTRKDFILPMFRAFDWDIDNSSEVSAEEKVSRGWVDYSFRLNGVPRFFLETKRVSEDLTKPEWVKQAIDYAWTKSVTWALLSDFEGLRVFNAEWQEDNPNRAQFIEFNVDTYLSDFDRLWWLSKTEIANGTLDREAEKVGKKDRRQPVSQHLFDDLKTWRHDLFRSLHAYNKQWSPAQIDDAVLRILNRLIFIRTAEDRKVEEVRLLPLVRELRDQKRIGQLLPELQKLFREFDAAYNSELFAKHRTDILESEPQPFEEVIDGLYGKKYLLYNFNAIDADVLGTAYEQYLGQVIADPEAADVVEKRAKRKSQGIFYTPTFVVKYIVQQTLGRYLDEHGFKPSKPVRILDMACGSGSFLIEAFDVLDRFVAQQRNQTRGNNDLRDHARQMELLTQCIYGVDKDEQAVSVARLNLLLKTLNYRDRLPMLQNIHHADSLRLDWHEDFKDVMKNGGFDIIIGNPPYVRQEALGEEFKTYAQKNFETYTGVADLYVYFIERAMSLLRPGGILGFIVGNKWLRVNYGEPLRRLLKQQQIIEIVDFGSLPVFQDATTYTNILIVCKGAPTASFRMAEVKSLDFDDLNHVVSEQAHNIAQDSLQDTGWSLSNVSTQVILDKLLAQGIPLSKYVNNKVYYGIKTGLNKAFVIDRAVRKRLIKEDSNSAKLIKPFIVGKDIKRYGTPSSDNYLIYTPWQLDINEYPAIKNHLAQWRNELKARPECRDGRYNWWCLARYGSEYVDEFAEPKFLWPGISEEVTAFAYDSTGYYGNDNTQMIVSHDLYLLGILNSKLSKLFLKSVADAVRGGFYRLKVAYISQLPIRQIDFKNKADKQRHDRIVKLVEEMLQLQKDYAAVNELDDTQHTLKRRIDQVDAEIDRIVYELYGLTAEEIKIVEGNA